MTDPIQTTSSQQQGQQGYTDDILAGDDIFTAIPEAIPEEEDLPYGDVLEKKYQFDPIPEVQEKSTTPIPPVYVAEEPVVEDVAENEVQDIESQSSLEQAKVENLLDTKLQTDVQKKFGELFFTVKKIYESKDILGTNEENFNILGADNDKVFISYKFLLDETSEPILFISKIEQDKETEEETANELRFAFNEESSSLEVMINDTLLFDEIKDFTENPKTKMQVMDKLNKFIFLASEELRKLEKEIKEKIVEKMQLKKLQEIFRNF